MSKKGGGGGGRVGEGETDANSTWIFCLRSNLKAVIT